MAVCKYHPERPGVGVCVRCQAVICAACSTKLDGINHCHECLKKLGGVAAAATGESGAVRALLMVSLALLWFFLLAWIMSGWLGPKFP